MNTEKYTEILRLTDKKKIQPNTLHQAISHRIAKRNNCFTKISVLRVKKKNK